MYSVRPSEERRVCALPGCSKLLKYGQERYCGRGHQGMGRRRGRWLECARNGCQIKFYLSSSAEKKGGLHYCSQRCKGIGQRVPQVQFQCPVCRGLVMRPRHKARQLRLTGSHPCCSRACVGVYAVLRQEFKQHGTEGIRDSFAQAVSLWIAGNPIDSKAAGGAYAFARHLADRAVQLATLPVAIVDDQVQVVVRREPG